MRDLIDRQAAIDAMRSYMEDSEIEDSDWHAAGIAYDIRRLPSAEPRWIPCGERLPEDGKWCLFTDGKNMSVERYKQDAIDHFFPNGRWFEFDDAVAWMPLPEPYEERSEADEH